MKEESSEQDYLEILLSGGSCPSVLGNFWSQLCLIWFYGVIYACGAYEWPTGEEGIDDLHLGITGTDKVFQTAPLKVSLNLY